MKSIPFVLLLLLSVDAICQNDSLSIKKATVIGNYFTDYSNYLHIKPYTLFKLNTLEIINEDEKLRLSPNSPTGLGVGLNYKFVGISVGFGLPHSKESINTYGKTNRLDLQLSLFTRNLGFDGHLQLYKGFYNENPGDFIPWDKSYLPQLPEMRTISIGTSVYYVLNNKKYSNKASVLRTQKQNKSAGSFLTGVFFSYDEAQSPDGFFPSELPDSISTDFDLNGFRYVAAGINLGYAFTWVISRSFFINASAISGGGYKYIRVSNVDGLSDAERHIHGQVLLRGVLGFEQERFYAGISASTLIRTINYKQYEIDLATEQMRLFIGWRIKTKE